MESSTLEGGSSCGHFRQWSADLPQVTGVKAVRSHAGAMRDGERWAWGDEGYGWKQQTAKNNQLQQLQGEIKSLKQHSEEAIKAFKEKYEAEELVPFRLFLEEEGLQSRAIK